jgi:hypothetical protein
MHEIDTDLAQPRIGGQTRAERVEIDLQARAHQARDGAGDQLLDLGPAQLESHLRPGAS